MKPDNKVHFPSIRVARSTVAALIAYAEEYHGGNRSIAAELALLAGLSALTRGNTTEDEAPSAEALAHMMHALQVIDLGEEEADEEVAA